jgi:hypothetical protein
LCLASLDDFDAITLLEPEIAIRLQKESTLSSEASQTSQKRGILPAAQSQTTQHKSPAVERPTLHAS